MRAFELDLRSLKFFRIFLGLILARFAFHELLHFAPLYAADGILPSSLVCGLQSPLLRLLSISCWSSENIWQFALLIMQVIAGLLLAAGFRSRLMAMTSAYLFYAFRARLMFVDTGGDTYLFWMTVCSIFLPLDGPQSQENRSTVGSPATLFFVLQVFCIYFFAGLNKYGESWTSGLAVHNAFHNSFVRSTLTDRISDFDGLNQFATYTVRFFEIFAPFLLFAPRLSSAGRYFIVVGFVLLFAGVGAFFYVDPLVIITIASWMAFLPSSLWERIGFAKPIAHGPAPVARHSVWCGIGLFAVVVMSTATLPWRPFDRAPIKTINHALLKAGFSQHWFFFAPEIFADSTWLSLEGSFAGADIKALDWLEAKVKEKDDPSLQDDFKEIVHDRRWQKMYRWFHGHEATGALERSFGNYICERYLFPKLQTFQVIEHEGGIKQESFTYNCETNRVVSSGPRRGQSGVDDLLPPPKTY